MKQISSELKNVNVEDMFIGMYGENKPFLLVLEGIKFLPIFTTPEKLEETVLRCKVPPVSTKQITDQWDFLDSIVGKIRIMVDPWITPEGNTRFTEILYE